MYVVLVRLSGHAYEMADVCAHRWRDLLIMRSFMRVLGVCITDATLLGLYIYITALGFVKPTTLKALRLEVNSTLAVVEQKSHP